MKNGLIVVCLIIVASSVALAGWGPLAPGMKVTFTPTNPPASAYSSDNTVTSGGQSLTVGGIEYVWNGSRYVSEHGLSYEFSAGGGYVFRDAGGNTAQRGTWTQP